MFAFPFYRLKLSCRMIAAVSFALTCFSTSLFAQDITGSAQDDLVVINAARNTIGINGQIQPLPSTDVVRILGLAGNDRVLFRGDPDTFERARMVGSTLIVEFGQRRIIAGGFETLQMQGDANDQLVMNDSSSDDHLVIADGATTLASANRRLIAEGFARIEVNSENGGNDTVAVAAVSLDRLVSRPGRVVLSSTQNPGPVARHFVNGFGRMETEWVRHFSLFDSDEVDQLILARRRLRWTSPVFEIDHVGDYERVVATSGPFGRTGEDRVSIRMQKEGDTRVTVQDDNIQRELVVQYHSPAKDLTLVNFEDMSIDILEGADGMARLYMNDGVADKNLVVEAETRSATLFVSFPYLAWVQTTGFDFARLHGGPATWFGTDGDDEVLSMHLGTSAIEDDEYRFMSDGFVFEHVAGDNPLGSSDFNNLEAFAGAGNDRGVFLDEGTSQAIHSDVLVRDGFRGYGWDDTATIYVGSSDSAAMFVETSGSTGAARVVASPTSVSFTGDGYSHKLFSFPHVGIGFHRFAGANDPVRDYGQELNEVRAVYNARDTGPLTLTRNGIAQYSRVSPSFNFDTQTATTAGYLFEAPGSEVIFYRNSYTFDTYTFAYEDGPDVNGLETIRLINQPADFTEQTLPPLTTPDG